MFTCSEGDPFSKIGKNCLSEAFTSLRFDKLSGQTLTYGIYLPLTIKKGYNIFSTTDFGENRKLEPGDVILLDQGYDGKVAIDRMSNISQLSDYWYNNQTMELKSINSTINYNFYLRMCLSPVKTLSTFKTYKSEGDYMISVLLNSQDLIGEASTSVRATAFVAIIDPILDLSLRTFYCQKDIVCAISWSISSGTAVNYSISTNGSAFITNLTTISYVYREIGFYILKINASNRVSQAVLDAEIECFDILKGLYFHAGDLSVSTSFLGSDASFLFYLKSGMRYKCFIDYGETTKDSFNDFAYNYNNTVFSNRYKKEGIYIVIINCSGIANSLELKFSHYVQSKLVGLELLKPGTTIQTPYYIEFGLLSGASVDQINLYVDGVLDKGTTWNSDTLKGLSSYYPNGDLYPGEHSIFINMSNIVSRLTLNTTFQISSTIVNPTFRIAPDVQEYLYPTTIDIIVSLESGANAKVEIWTGDEKDISVPSLVYTVEGKWIRDLTIPYTFKTPGMHEIYLNFSNSINFVTTSRLSINIEGPVDGLNVTLYQIPVIYYLAGYGEAQFKFFYSDIAKAGTDAEVTFWPGDSDNNTYGPFQINMNYIYNYNENPLLHRYYQIANYTASFLLENRFGKKVIQIAFQVIPGLDGFYIDCEPKRTVRQRDIQVSAFVIQGKDVVFNWYLDGVLLHNAARKCKHISFLLLPSYY